MNARTLLTPLVIAALAVLTACGGGASSPGSPTPPTGGSSPQSVQSQTEDAINTANEFGTPVKDFSSFEETTSSPLQAAARRPDVAVAQTAGDGTCHNGIEFFAPDKNGDADSTERIEFYDNGCTAMARDAIRLYTSTGSTSETVHRTVSLYALNGTSPAAVRSETLSYTNAAFDTYGYPVVQNGFARTQTGELNFAGTKTIAAGGELVVAPSSGDSTTFCADSAGFNATGDASLDETFGWAGVLPSGTRTVNSDGSVTWSSTHNGTAYTGAIGALSITAGAQNLSCPVVTPMFTLAGGTAKGSFTLPVSATYSHGILTNLTIQNATLRNGDTLNVATNSGVSPGDIHFISGTLANGAAAVATFNVDAFGDGVLTVNASGKQYAIEDWHIVKA